MKITNDLNLPLPIVEAIRNDPYDNQGTLSVTTLLRPPQAWVLSKRHAGEIVEDASDRIWSLVGQIGHLIIERAAGNLDPEKFIAERRFHGTVEGTPISGQADLIEIDNKTVFDFKFTSGWAVKDAMTSGKSDWRIQLSVLAHLARVNGVEIERGKIVAIVRDWTESAAAKNRDWPQKPIAVIDMDIMGQDETAEWIAARIAEFKAAEAGDIRPCTDEERWHSPGKWAVYKGSNIKAAKLEDSEEALSAWIFANRPKLGADYRIEQRPTEFKRCAKYCAAAAFCPQFQATKATSEVE
jgi:hypothetical protein